jgi:hypothetical protein
VALRSCQNIVDFCMAPQPTLNVMEVTAENVVAQLRAIGVSVDALLSAEDVLFPVCGDLLVCFAGAGFTFCVLPIPSVRTPAGQT